MFIQYIYIYVYIVVWYCSFDHYKPYVFCWTDGLFFVNNLRWFMVTKFNGSFGEMSWWRTFPSCDRFVHEELLKQLQLAATAGRWDSVECGVCQCQLSFCIFYRIEMHLSTKTSPCWTFSSGVTQIWRHTHTPTQNLMSFQQQGVLIIFAGTTSNQTGSWSFIQLLMSQPSHGMRVPLCRHSVSFSQRHR